MCGRPFRSKRNLKSGVARGRVLTCVRPLMRRGPCRGPRWESGDQVQFKPTRLKRLSQAPALDALVAKLVVLIPSLDRAPSLSADPPTPDSLAVVTAPTSPQPELDKPHLWP